MLKGNPKKILALIHMIFSTVPFNLFSQKKLKKLGLDNFRGIIS